MSVIERLKKKWDIKNNFDFTMIMIVFSLAGMNVSLCRKPLFHLLGVQRETSLWIKTLVYLAFVFPTYQLSLLLYGFILGQFQFFWKKQKSLVQFIRGKFVKTRTA